METIISCGVLQVTACVLQVSLIVFIKHQWMIVSISCGVCLHPPPDSVVIPFVSYPAAVTTFLVSPCVAWFPRLITIHMTANTISMIIYFLQMIPRVHQTNSASHILQYMWFSFDQYRPLWPNTTFIIYNTCTLSLTPNIYFSLLITVNVNASFQILSFMFL